jgi:hypothetical protein
MKKNRAFFSMLVSFLFVLTACTSAASYDKYDDAERYTIGSANVLAESIETVEIDWINGSIEIEQTAARSVNIIEEGSFEKEAERMRYYLDEGVLKVKYCESGFHGEIHPQNKNLRVEIPAGLALEIDSKGAEITIGVLDVTNLSIETETGNVMAERISSHKTELETKSGKVSIGELISKDFSVDCISGGASVARLSVDTLEAETVSGDLSFGIQKAVNADILSKRGVVTVTLGEGLGASIRMGIPSGKFKTEKEYVKSGRRYDVFGADGSSLECKIHADIFGGELNVR